MRKLTPEEAAALGLEEPAPRVQRKLTPEEVAALGLEPPVKSLQYLADTSNNAQTALQQRYLSEGPAAMARQQLANEQGPASRAMIKAGREVDKLRAGINQLGYSALAGIVPKGRPDLLAQVNELKSGVAQDQAEKDIAYRELGAQESWPAAIGGALPYLLSGLAVPAVGSAAKVGLNAAIRTPSVVANVGKSALTDIVNTGASSSNTAIKNIASKAQRELTGPWSKQAAFNANKVKILDPYNHNTLESLLGSLGVGSAEGAAQYDKTAQSGAVNSLTGGVLGNVIKPSLTRMPNYRANNPNETAVIDWATQNGFKLTKPGMINGSRRYQKFEHGMRNDSTFADPLHMVDQANSAVSNRIASESMGLPAKAAARTQFTPKELSDHMETLGKEYDALEQGTVAHFTPGDKVDLLNHLKTLRKDTTAQGKAIVSDVADYYKQIGFGNKARPLTQAGPAVNPVIKQGSEYKELRRRLLADINDSYANGNTYRASALKPVLAKVDSAVANGIMNKGGTATLSQWKDLNERYAMTQLVLNHGLTPLGTFDPYKLLNHFEQNDVGRMVLGTAAGKRVDNLHKLAKLEYMTKHQMGSDMSGMGVKNIFNKSNPGIMEKLLSSHWAGSVNSVVPFGTLGLKAYLSGYPVSTGLLNLSGKGLGDAALPVRALSQSTEPDKSIKSLKNYLKIYD